MAIRPVEDRQHQEFGAAFLQGLRRDIRWCHIGMKHIYMTETGQETLVIGDCGPKKRVPCGHPRAGTLRKENGLIRRREASAGPAAASGCSVVFAAGDGTAGAALASLVSSRAKRAASPACCGSYTPHSSLGPDVRAIGSLV